MGKSIEFLLLRGRQNLILFFSKKNGSPEKKMEKFKLFDFPAEIGKWENRDLTFDEFQRYSRQLILPEIGKNGQINLFNSKVLIVGCGGLGKFREILRKMLKHF